MYITNDNFIDMVSNYKNNINRDKIFRMFQEKYIKTTNYYLRIYSVGLLDGYYTYDDYRNEIYICLHEAICNYDDSKALNNNRITLFKTLYMFYIKACYNRLKAKIEKDKNKHGRYKEFMTQGYHSFNKDMYNLKYSNLYKSLNEKEMEVLFGIENNLKKYKFFKKFAEDKSSVEFNNIECYYTYNSLLDKIKKEFSYD